MKNKLIILFSVFLSFQAMAVITKEEIQEIADQYDALAQKDTLVDMLHARFQDVEDLNKQMHFKNIFSELSNLPDDEQHEVVELALQLQTSVNAQRVDPRREDGLDTILREGQHIVFSLVRQPTIEARRDSVSRMNGILDGSSHNFGPVQINGRTLTRVIDLLGESCYLSFSEWDGVFSKAQEKMLDFPTNAQTASNFLALIHFVVTRKLGHNSESEMLDIMQIDNKINQFISFARLVPVASQEDFLLSLTSSTRINTLNLSEEDFQRRVAYLDLFQRDRDRDGYVEDLLNYFEFTSSLSAENFQNTLNIVEDIVNDFPEQQRSFRNFIEVIKCCGDSNYADFLRWMLDQHIALTFQIVNNDLMPLGIWQYSSQFYTQLMERMTQALHAGDEINVEALAVQVRDHFTQLMADERPPQGENFMQGQAFQIHNSAHLQVTFPDGRITLPFAVSRIIRSLNGEDAMETQQACEEITDLFEGEEKVQVQQAVTKGYGLNENVPYRGEITDLLGYVWPYMKTFSVEIQKAWALCAVEESHSAYEGSYGLSCAKGIQERFVLTGFLEHLEGVDSRLKGFSKFAQLIGNMTSFKETALLQGLNELDEEQLTAITQLGLKEDGAAAQVEAYMYGVLWKYALALFPPEGADGMRLAQDFLSTHIVKQKMVEAVEMYTEKGYFDHGLGKWQKQALGKLAELKSSAEKDSSILKSTSEMTREEVRQKRLAAMMPSQSLVMPGNDDNDDDGF